MQIYDSGSKPVRGQYAADASSQTPVANATERSEHGRPCPKPRPDQPDESQTHVHEFQGSTRIAEEEEEPHNHRFAGVSSQVIPWAIVMSMRYLPIPTSLKTIITK